MHGRHYIKLSSTTQKVVSLSSGESEWHGLVKSASVALGYKGMCSDFGIERVIELTTDSSAAKGIGSRRGWGRVKHLDLETLWLQGVVTRKELVLTKCDGKVTAADPNIADLGTKHLDSVTMWKLMAMMGFQQREGKSKIAFDVQQGRTG